MDEVLLCYHSFCLADDIMEALMLRYDTPSQEDGKTVKLRYSLTSLTCVGSIFINGFRILNFIRKWSTAYWYDWVLDPSLNEKALNFLNSIETSKVALTIKSRLEKRVFILIPFFIFNLFLTLFFRMKWKKKLQKRNKAI